MKIGYDERIMYPAVSIGLFPSSTLSSTLSSTPIRPRAHGREARSLRLEERLGLEEKGSDPDGEGLLFKPEEFLTDRVRRAVEKLPPMQREFILCFYFEGRSYTQVALLLGITVKKAIRLHQKAKSSLRRLLIPLLQVRRAHHKEEFKDAET